MIEMREGAKAEIHSGGAWTGRLKCDVMDFNAVNLEAPHWLPFSFLFFFWLATWQFGSQLPFLDRDGGHYDYNIQYDNIFYKKNYIIVIFHKSIYKNLYFYEFIYFNILRMWSKGGTTINTII